MLERIRICRLHDMFEFLAFIWDLKEKIASQVHTERRVKTILLKRGEGMHSSEAEDRVLFNGVISLPPGLRKRWHTHVEAPLILLVL